MIPKQFPPLGGKGSPSYARAPFNVKPLPRGGEIVPYVSPGPNSLTNAAGQRLLPPAGRTSPPNGFYLEPNNLTNIKPNRGQPFNPNPNGAKGNVNVNSGLGNGVGGAAAAGGAGAAPIIVGGVGFGAGVALGNSLYEGAEVYDSPAYKFSEFLINNTIRRDNPYKLGNESKIQSRGGVEISPQILPFQGGQTSQRYGVFVEAEFTNYNPDGSIAGRGTGQAITYAQGPISSVSIKSGNPNTPYYLEVKGKDDFISKAYYDWYSPTEPGRRIVAIIINRNIFRTDGTSLQNDIVQGGNPNPTQVGTHEPVSITNITNNTTNNTTNNNYPSPPPFAEPPPKSWPPPPAIKPNPEPKTTDTPAPSPKPTTTPNPVSGPITINKPNIAPGSYPAPAPGSATTLGPITRTNSGTGSGSSGPSGQTLPSPAAPAPFAEPPEPGKFTALPLPVLPTATSSSPSPTSNLAPVNNGQVVNAPQTERERVGFPVEETGGSCCALPAIQSGNNRILDRLNGLNNAAQDALLVEVLNRLGPQVQGGLSGWLGRFSRSIRLDRVVNLLSLLLAIHNAGMLSRSLIDSISFLIDSSANLIGLKDEDDNPIDINAMIGSSVNAFLSNLLGAETYQGLSDNWKKLSAIYTSAINIYELTLSSMAGMAEGLQIMGQYTGRIGNALKRSGAILENSYQWMDENIRIKTGRFAQIQAITDGIGRTEDLVSNLTEVTDNIQETSENVRAIQGEFKNIKDKVKENEDEKMTKETESKTASQGAVINTKDLVKPSGDN